MVNGVVDDFSELTLILSKVVLSDMLDSQNNPTPNHWGIACPFIVVGSGENAEKNFLCCM